MMASLCRRQQALAPLIVESRGVYAVQVRQASETTTAEESQRHTPPRFRRARLALAREWFRTYGHHLAFVNPLRRDGLMVESLREVERALPSTLQPIVQPLVDSRQLNTDLCFPSASRGSEEEPHVRSLLDQYCAGIGYEFMHCTTDEERQFFIEAIEGDSMNQTHTVDDTTTLWCYEQVLRAGAWERLLGRRYPTCRRFSIEGLESAILALNAVIDTFASGESATSHEKRVVLGSLHRGRVNIIHTVLQRSASSLLSEWDLTDGPSYDDINLGHSTDVTTKHGQTVHVSLLAMPAHLESQDASIAGKARGHMTVRAMESTRTPTFDESIARSILPLVVHGDASFCGQGIVSETLQLSTFRDFQCAGTIHVILNNQIGFTSETQQMRSNRHRLVHVSDLALGVRAPVLHVNAERPLDVLRAAILATEYRQRFGKDVVLDLWGFRKYGHNEMDDPRITNVRLYQEVDQHKPTADVFAALLSDSLRDECHALQKRINADYEELATKKRQTESEEGATREESSSGDWLDMMAHPISSNVTGVELNKLSEALTTLATIPEGFTLHQATRRAVSRRIALLQSLEDPEQIDSLAVDWATAELLALCTLADESHFCRLCGQDSQRGTFGQRHAVWHDAITGEHHHALPPSVQVVDSPLSELGVLGFEHGFSLASPNFLVLWEAQFADFVNNSQVLIDTMIAAEKEKFKLESNLVLLLPHGYDGMGPEHSSSRVERFLTLHTDTPDAAKETKDEVERVRASNFLVAYPTSPANYFHLLRRSFTWPFRRPMVVLTPKRTLRLAQATSPLNDFLKSSEPPAVFSPVLDDPRRPSHNVDQVKSIVVCAGEIFYDVMRLAENLPGEVSQRVAIVRIEQLAPFPLRKLNAVVETYPNVERAVWVQEEPGNMGALRFVAPFLEIAFPHVSLTTPVSRPVSAAPAVGNPRGHRTSQRDLMARITEWLKG